VVFTPNIGVQKAVVLQLEWACVLREENSVTLKESPYFSVFVFFFKACVGSPFGKGLALFGFFAR
jgi:hypothetical protein